MSDGEKSDSHRVALRINGSLGRCVERRSAFVEHRKKAFAIPVLLMPLKMPEEAAELEPLLLPKAQDVSPVQVSRVQFALAPLEDFAEVRPCKNSLQALVIELVVEGIFPNRVSDLLAQTALNKVRSLRDEK
jgi:hypothetical protein